MIPLYLLSSACARLRGGDFYWDNRFEREAYAKPSTKETSRSEEVTHVPSQS
jgi:hypothetical protein